MHAPAAGRDRGKRLARCRIPAADVDLHHAGTVRHIGRQAGDRRAGGRIRRGDASPDVVDDALGLPRFEVAELLGKRRGIGGAAEGLDGQDGRCGVMAVRRRGRRRESGDDHVGPELADHANHVCKDGLPVPDAERLLRVLAVAKVLRAREVLPSAVEPARGEQLLRARHPQRLAELGTEQVLSAVTAGERQVRGAVSATAREVGDDLGVLVVGMRGDVQHARHRREAAELLEDRGPRRDLGSVADVGCAHQYRHADGGKDTHVSEREFHRRFKTIARPVGQVAEVPPLAALDPRM